MSNTQAPAQEVKAEDEPVKPLQILTNGKFLTAAQVGIGIAIDLNPETKAIKEASDFTRSSQTSPSSRQTFANSVVESHLLVVKEEAETLKDIRQREGNLNSPDAQAILQDLKAGHFSQDGTATFLLSLYFRCAWPMVWPQSMPPRNSLEKLRKKLPGSYPPATAWS